MPGEPEDHCSKESAVQSVEEAIVVGRRIRLGHDQPCPQPAAILVRDGIIEAVSPGCDRAPSGWPTARTIDLGELVAGPAFIDMHVHVTETAHGASDVVARPIDDGECRAHARHALESLLSVGVTAARDCGGPPPLIFRISRDARLASDQARLYAAGAPLTPPGGHAARMGGEASGGFALEKLVEKFAASGATQIKVMASGGGTTGSNPWDAAFTSDELERIVAASRAANLPVTAHCLSANSIRQALAAGVRVIEHAKFRSPGDRRIDARTRAEVARELVNHEAVVVSTLSVGHYVLERAPAATEIREVWSRRQHNDLLDTRDLIDSGVTLAAGTDAGWRWTPFDALPTELRLLTQSGMSAGEALRAGTQTAAEAARLPGVKGRLTVGSFADLVAYPADPHKDITVLESAARVVRGVAAKGTSPELR
ncbi:amidohydrolase family protein [Mycolicibacterium lutetiense]